MKTIKKKKKKKKKKKILFSANIIMISSRVKKKFKDVATKINLLLYRILNEQGPVVQK